ncbi:MAG: ATP-binding protein [Desulfobacteraceae bacterium]|jgi:PAS domain S-box-containing protein
MKIAIVGAGRQGVRLMELLQQHEFREIQPEIKAVADINPDAPGMVKARRSNIPITNDYRDFFKMPDIDLIVELTGDQDVFHEILKHKDPDVRAISSNVVKIFWEISRVSVREKKTRQELIEANAMYKVVINDLIQEDVMVINCDYRIVDMNKSLMEKLGLTHDEVVGRQCYEITHHHEMPCSGDKHPCPLLETLENKRPYQTTHVHLDKNDRERYHAISTYPLFEEGDVIGAVEISRDITKDINVQKTLMQQEKLASIGRLSAGVAHEINNPMTTILTSAMLIQEDLDEDDPIRQELDLIASETMRCRKIVTSLLNFARQSQPDKRLNDLNQVITESELLTHKQAAFKDIAINCELSPKIPQMHFDKGQIEQAVINLILNAVEATPQGGRITLSTKCCDEKGFALISICDNGEGISKEDLNKIFDPFFTTKDAGTGLGLAITHGIIEQHGGRIEAESQVGEGTCFNIKLPLNKENSNGRA